MIRSFPTFDPEARLRFWFNWTPWVSVEAGGTIATYAVTVTDGDGALLVEGSIIGTGAFASYIMCWIAGGTEGLTYTLTCHVTLTDGSAEDASRTVAIAQH